MSEKIVTAGIVLIGDELLSGRTQDTNLGTIARWLEPIGVQVGEARIVPDDAKTISATVRAFSERFDYVFTTGGIGPTHDDITADCIAAAFGMGISERADAIEVLLTRYEPRAFKRKTSSPSQVCRPLCAECCLMWSTALWAGPKSTRAQCRPQA